MDEFKKSIDRQIEFNKGKNIFFDRPGLFQFIDETIKAISNLKGLSGDTENILIDYVTDKVLEEFCRVNQYYSFDSKSRQDLRKIYAELFLNIQSESSTNYISVNHYQKLKDWLVKYNSFADKIYSNKEEFTDPVPCFEYSPEVQLEILGVDIQNVVSPVLDIGCGKEGSLVNYFISKGFNAFGIDRCNFSSPELFTADWLEYNYGKDKWGTIVSNLGFSNHFKHHNLRADGNFLGYAKTYMNILHSLKVGGSFLYAPDLPFIERFLDSHSFELTKNKIPGHGFMASGITRLQ